jgi:protein phosphatase
LLLCSDGVTDYLSDAAVAELLKTSDAAVAVRRLVDSALARGSRDNVTAVIADVVTSTQPRDGWLDMLPAASDPN